MGGSCRLPIPFQRSYIKILGISNSSKNCCVIFIKRNCTSSCQTCNGIMTNPSDHLGAGEPGHRSEHICSQEEMSSTSFSRTKSFPPVNMVFDLLPDAHIARDGNRDELSNQRIKLCLYNGVQDWNGLQRALAEDYGMEVKAEDDIVYVSGYATRDDYNYNGEIRKIVARYRRVSKSFSM